MLHNEFHNSNPPFLYSKSRLEDIQKALGITTIEDAFLTALELLREDSAGSMAEEIIFLKNTPPIFGKLQELEELTSANALRQAFSRAVSLLQNLKLSDSVKKHVQEALFRDIQENISSPTAIKITANKGSWQICFQESGEGTGTFLYAGLRVDDLVASYLGKNSSNSRLHKLVADLITENTTNTNFITITTQNSERWCIPTPEALEGLFRESDIQTYYEADAVLSIKAGCTR